MAEITYRIPSRTVQYGYVEVKRNWSDDEPTDPEMLAAAYVSYVYAFQKEEEATVRRIQDGVQEASEAALAASQPEVDHLVDPVDKAAQMLAEGLGGATEIEDELGFPSGEAPVSIQADGTAPWKQEVATPKKPWETETEKPNRPVHPIVTPDW
jgi:hypothetical protein